MSCVATESREGCWREFILYHYITLSYAACPHNLLFYEDGVVVAGRFGASADSCVHVLKWAIHAILLEARLSWR